MKDSTGVCSDPSRIAINFNNFFANIGPSLASKVPSTQFSHKDFLVGHFADCFFLNPTSPAEVASIVHSLKNSKCEGVDGLFMSPIKETVDLLAVPLAHICNLSFERGVFPDKLKIAKILPVFRVMSLLCSQTIGLFLFSPVFLRSSRNFFTSGYQDFSQSLISLIIISMALDHINLLPWLS